jgi:DNA polymerase-3 subunit chi
LTPESNAQGRVEIGFYHLTRTGSEQALPQLLGRTLAAGQRALVLCPNAERVTELDAVLWQCTDPDWLPHGTAADGDVDLQPIWLTTEGSAPDGDEPPNGARFLFLIDGAQSARLNEFDRVFDLFDGNDAAAVAAARERWTAAKAAGHTLAYWQQGPRGWEKK